MRNTNRQVRENYTNGVECQGGNVSAIEVGHGEHLILRSYATTVGHRFETASGVISLYPTCSYSNTTSHHITLVGKAIRLPWQLVESNGRFSSLTDYLEALEAIKRMANKLLEQQRKGRKNSDAYSLRAKQLEDIKFFLDSGLLEVYFEPWGMDSQQLATINTAMEGLKALLA